MPTEPSLTNTASIAYFSMEIALQSDMPTYSGGLGVLAGDTLRAAADLEIPIVAVTLVYRRGYLSQALDSSGWQTEQPAEWYPERRLEEVRERVEVAIEGRNVTLRAWKYEVKGATGGTVEVLLLDADVPENNPEDRALTDRLYGGDARYRLCQEVILGIGGVRLLRALGFRIARYHTNEGHAALLGLELLDEQATIARRSRFNHEDVECVRKLCVFTTHTPVPAGHDKFPLDLARSVIGRPEIYEMHEVFCCDGVLNMTYLALNLSRYVNGVAKRHGDISQHMFATHKIEAITNGIHVATWACEPFKDLFDRFLPGWRLDYFSLRYALQIPLDAIRESHASAKAALLARIGERTGVEPNGTAFTIGFGRRATAYKRATLVLRDLDRLRRIADEVGPLQIVYAGKAHPHDEDGKRLIQEIVRVAELLRGKVPVFYLEGYDEDLARLMVSGTDLWLNTPEPPLEASGTSGMKAAVNAVPTLSMLDGWWLEGHIEGVTGWSIGQPDGTATGDEKDAAELYQKLEHVILPLFHGRPDDYAHVMRQTLAFTGSFFNTHRMIQQYVAHAYRSNGVGETNSNQAALTGV